MFPAELLIVDIVDTTVFEILLHMDDHEVLRLFFTSISGETVDLIKAGNLADRFIRAWVKLQCVMRVHVLLYGQIKTVWQLL